MDERRVEALEERVGRLETAVEERSRKLRYALRRLNRLLADGRTGVAGERGRSGAPPTLEAPFPSPMPAAATSHTSPPEPSGEREEDAASSRDLSGSGEGGRFSLPFDLGALRSGEWWLNKVGIALLLFGVAFLFKFSWDQGWLQVLLTPWIRVGLGLAIGGALVYLGLRVYEGRRAFGQVLLGGGIGVFYITGFAVFQVLHLVPYPVAYGFMVAVTLLAFVLSLRQNEAVLSLIGTLGGFATPLILYTEAGPLGGLVLYASLILAGACAVYLFKEWRSLLLVSFGGVWTVLLLGTLSVYPPELAARVDQRALQAGVVFGWLALWLVPVAREALRSRDTSRWPLPEPRPLARGPFGDDGDILRSSALAHLLSAATPLVTLFLTQGIWDMERGSLGWITLGMAAAHALVSAVLSRVEGGGRMYYTQGLTALLLGTLALVLLLEGDALFFTLAAEATVLHLVARRLSDRIVRFEAHALFVAVALWLGGRLALGALETSFVGAENPAFFNVRALVDLAAITLAAGASVAIESPAVRRVYRVLAHAAVLGLLLRELIALPDGDTLAFVSWTLYGVGLHLLSRRFPAWGTVVGAHLLSVVIGLWLGVRLTGGIVDPGSAATAVFTLQGLADLVVLLLAVPVSRLSVTREVGTAYRLAAHAALLAWIWRELSLLPDGDAYVTIAWGLYAAGLLVIGLRIDGVELVRGGMATLFLVVTKLFLWDLAGVEAIWRVLLFLGFGGLFLVLSYYLQALWRPDAHNGTTGPSDGV
jgi:hypothetical protein